jgi:putative transposase
MKINAQEIYHIYNQGNNGETIFYADGDYLEFLGLFRKYVYTHCTVLAYCLMPNHFHFLIYATEDSAAIKRIGNIDSCELSNGFRLLQSSYAQYINKKEKRTGSLFRQKAKAKSMIDGDVQHQFTAFHYIHQNPFKAGLVKKLEDWYYSSFRDFAGLRNGTLCDRVLAEQLIGFDKTNLMAATSQNIDDALIQKIFNPRSAPKVRPGIGDEVTSRSDLRCRPG